MDANSESEDRNCNVPMKNINVSVSSKQEGHNNKPKRQMKTPFQLETLEKAYAVETYPSEATRTKLSKKLDLTDRQLQMWFCHRRLKDRKEDKRDAVATKKPRKEPTLLKKSPLLEFPVDQELNIIDDNDPDPAAESDYESQCGSGFNSFVDAADTSDVANLDKYTSMSKPYHQSSPLLSCKKLQAISYVEAQLDGPFRGDGPVLGFEFDPLPPDAFGVSIGTMAEQYDRNSNQRFRRHEGKLRKGSTRSLHEHGQLVQPSYNGSPIDTIRGRRISKYLETNLHYPRALTATKSPSMSYTSPQSKGSNHFLSSPNTSDHNYLQPPESALFMNDRRNEKSKCNSIIKQKYNNVFQDAKVFRDGDDDTHTRKKHKVNRVHLEPDNSLKA
ncbi:unnamed protein product [Linum trigynum]|uniref:Homeobox domain-containing protein n=1 Tax=Linum trigynum TaxID=586398 RepID=A0AAV2DG25_9ROSI